jgi:nucleoside phosphorylase
LAATAPTDNDGSSSSTDHTCDVPSTDAGCLLPCAGPTSDECACQHAGLAAAATRPSVRLYKAVAARIDDERFKTLCFICGVDVDSLSGTSKLDKARELLSRYEASGELEVFADILAEFGEETDLPDNDVGRPVEQVDVASATPGQRPSGIAHSTRRFDVAVMAVKLTELQAAKAAFGISLERHEDELANGRRYWFTTVAGAGGTSLRVILTMVGAPRNTPCALACSALLERYDVDACILCGIAAGVRGKVKIGDIVVSEPYILDYEGATLGPVRWWKRPYTVPLHPQMMRHIAHFAPLANGWVQELAERWPVLSAGGVMLPETGPHSPEYHTGVILAGEKLLRNGRLPKMRREYGDLVRAGEMEGSGFAQACHDLLVPWAVFRGISDYGDRRKSDREQGAAALAAATAAATFVKTAYRRSD